MEHNTCRENLSAYLDNELSAGEKLALEGHLASCADCTRELAELKRVSDVFKKHVMQPVPTALKEEVFAEKPAAPVFSGWLKPVLVFSATAAGLLLVFGLPKFWSSDSAYSPALFSNSASRDQGSFGSKAGGPVSSFSGEMYGESGATTAAAAKSVGEASSSNGSSLDVMSGGSVSAMSAPSQSSPRSTGKGAYGQAKFAGRRTISGGNSSGAVIASKASVYRGSASSAFSGSMAAAADKSAARPEWLDEMVRRLQAGEKGNPPYLVWRYSYKGNTVYYLPPQCCDQYSQLYDEAGKLLCAPDGGKTGQGDGKCVDFFKVRTGGELIWQDPRK